MLAKNEEDSVGNQMNDLLGPPPLIQGEDAARYWRLHAAIAHEIKPETFFDKICIREFADKLWQQQRCKQGAASIVESAYVEAFRHGLSAPLRIDPIMS